MFLIDPPSPFSSPAEWRAFGERMRTLSEENPRDATIREGLKTFEKWERAQLEG